MPLQNRPGVNLASIWVLGCGKEDSRENASTNDLEEWTLTLAGDIDRDDSTNVHQVLAELDKSRDRRSLDFWRPLLLTAKCD